MGAVATEIEVEQGTPEWLDCRIGRITASRIADVLATIKSDEAANRKAYKGELIYERLTGTQWESFQTRDMQFGDEQEEVARLTYQLKTGIKVRKCGFFQHNELMAGASPDGMMLEHHGSIEIKVPRLYNHIETLRLQRIPSQYVGQVHMQMYMTGCEFVDFISYSPFLTNDAQMFIQRIRRDEEFVALIAKEIAKFSAEVDEEVKFVQDYKAPILAPNPRKEAARAL